MRKISLLDCTLRDGGYVNDWNFGHNNLVSIFERLVSAKVEFIELGFIDERRGFDINRSIAPDTASFNRIFQDLDKGDSLLVGMIDYGTCGIENIQPCSEGVFDGIRVIFKKHARTEAIAFCKQIKQLGYKVFVQLVSITSYDEAELQDLICLANSLEPYAVSIVDTYGLLYQDNLLHYFELLDANLKPGISIGYHAHNNFQMGYANCIAMMNLDTERELLVDGTIHGMGKSAGNAPLELIAMWMNDNLDKKYHLNQILEAVDSNIKNFYSTPTWGYSMPFFISARNKCHPKYVFYLVDKRTLSIHSINQILDRLQREKKLSYDEEYIEKLYQDYQDKDTNDIDDIKLLKNKLTGKNILLLGPGTNLYRQYQLIKDYIEKEFPIVVSINFIDELFDIDYVFLSNSKRYVQLATALSQKDRKYKIISTSNVTKTSGRFDYVLKYSLLIDRDAEVIDNSFLMFLKVLERIEIHQVVLAGFDGYKGAGEADYIRPNLEYHFDKAKADRVNQSVIDELHKRKNDLQVIFITDSIYSQQEA